MDMFTGETFIHNSQESNNKSFHDLDEYLEGVYSGFNVFLILSGNNASSVVLFQWELPSEFDHAALQYHFYHLKTFYVDEYNDTDEGLLKGSLLHLNEERLTNLIETVLSGDWTNLSHGFHQIHELSEFGISHSDFDEDSLEVLDRRTVPDFIRRLLMLHMTPTQRDDSDLDDDDDLDEDFDFDFDDDI